MSQFPPESPYDPPTQPFGPGGGAPSQGNGLAVTSLVFGLVGFCLPVLGGLLAILFGILGLNKAKNPRVTGKGMAIAGLLLGIVTTVGYGVGGYFFVTAIKKVVSAVGTAPAEFIADLSKGDVNDALTKVDAASVDRARVEAAVEEVKPFGAFQSYATDGQPTTSTVNNVSEMTIPGIATYDKGPKKVTIMLRNSPMAPFTFKIFDWSFK